MGCPTGEIIDCASQGCGWISNHIPCSCIGTQGNTEIIFNGGTKSQSHRITDILLDESVSTYRNRVFRSCPSPVTHGDGALGDGQLVGNPCHRIASECGCIGPVGLRKSTSSQSGISLSLRRWTYSGGSLASCLRCGAHSERIGSNRLGIVANSDCKTMRSAIRNASVRRGLSADRYISCVHSPGCCAPDFESCACVSSHL